MAQLHVRDVPDEVVATLDRTARRRGVSRNAVIVETLERASAQDGPATTVTDLRRFADGFGDLGNDELIDALWRK